MPNTPLRPRRRLRRGILAVAAIAALAGASAASAATVAVNGTTLTYDAAASKINQPQFTQAATTNPDTVSVYTDPGDDDPITPGAGCTAVAAGGGQPDHVDCTGVSAVVANLGDGI